MDYLIFDTEYSIKEYYKRSGNPWYCPLVAIAFKNKQELYKQWIYPNKIKDFEIDEDILVGHNIGVDLLYLWHTKGLQDFFKRGGKIWDTMLAEYTLSGQQLKYPSLRDIAIKYGCKEREKFMEEYWFNKKGFFYNNSYKEYITDWKEFIDFQNGNYTEDEFIEKMNTYGLHYIEGPINTMNIPQRLVLTDVENDIRDTEQVYLKQIERAKQERIYNLIEDHMDGLLATIEIEYNGIFCDKELLKKNREKLFKELEIMKEKLNRIVEGYWK